MKCLRSLFLGSLLVLGLSGVAFGQGGNLSPPPTYTSLPNFAGLGVRPSLEYIAGDGIGFEDGYAKLGFFAPALQAPGDWIVFSDFRFLMDNNQNVGGNFGLGYRRYVASMDRTFGGYGYYDARQTDIDHYQQITVGLETRGQFFDAVLNAYVPIGDDVGQRTNVIANGPITQSGNNLLAPGILTSENAMTGVDFNVFGRLPLDIDADIRPFAGAYWFTNSGEGDAVGGLVGMDAAIASMARVSVHYQNDDVFGSQVVAQFAFTFPARLRREEPYYNNVRDTLADPVDRLDFIVLNQTFENVGVALTNPDSNEPVFIVYVDDDAVGPGDGTTENPFNDLASAEAAAPENAIIYLRDGEYDRDDEDFAITLQDGQRLLGPAVAHMVPTVELGNVLFPEAPGGEAVIELAENQAGVALADVNEVAGITIDGDDEDGTAGIISQPDGRSNDIIIRNNIIENLQLEGIELGNVGGNILIENNVLDDVANDNDPGIQVDIDDNGDTIVSILGNTVETDSDEATGIRVRVEGSDSRGLLNVSGNTITGTFEDGILIDTDENVIGGEIIATVNNNSVTDALRNGIRIRTEAEGSTISFSATGNTVTNSANEGFLVEADADGSTINAIIFENPFGNDSGDNDFFAKNEDNATFNLELRDNFSAVLDGDIRVENDNQTLGAFTIFGTSVNGTGESFVEGELESLNPFSSGANAAGSGPGEDFFQGTTQNLILPSP